MSADDVSDLPKQLTSLSCWRDNFTSDHFNAISPSLKHLRVNVCDLGSVTFLPPSLVSLSLCDIQTRVFERNIPIFNLPSMLTQLEVPLVHVSQQQDLARMIHLTDLSVQIPFSDFVIDMLFLQTLPRSLTKFAIHGFKPTTSEVVRQIYDWSLFEHLIELSLCAYSNDLYRQGYYCEQSQHCNFYMHSVFPPSLKSLEIAYHRVKLQPDLISSVPDTLTRLSLVYQGKSYPFLTTFPRSLKHLSIDNSIRHCCSIPLDVFASLPPYLQSLDVDFGPSVDVEFLLALPPALTSLNIKHSKLLIAAIQHVPKLKHFSSAVELSPYYSSAPFSKWNIDVQIVETYYYHTYLNTMVKINSYSDLRRYEIHHHELDAQAQQNP